MLDKGFKWIEIQNRIRKMPGYDKVTYQIAQQWMIEILGHPKPSSKRGRKVNEEFESAVIQKLFITILFDVILTGIFYFANK